MKALIWLAFIALVAVWTVLVALTDQLGQWLLSRTEAGQIQDMADMAAAWPVPAWLGFWVDTAWLKALQDTGNGLVQWLGQVLPSVDGLMAWISPLLWGVWGLGLLAMLACTVFAHWLLGQRRATALRATR